MMKILKKMSIVLMATLLILAGCNNTNKESRKVLRLAATQPFTTLNHQTTIMVSEIEQISQFMEGLIGYDAMGNLIPTGAEKYEVTEDGMSYTFTLRKDAIWTNGDKVTAKDYEFAWKMMATNDTGGFRMNGAVIKNGAKILNKELPASALGVSAIDDVTLLVELEKNYPTFLQMIASYLYFPINKLFYESVGGEESYGKSIETILSNGAFTLTEYKADEKLFFEKSNTYWDKENVNLEEIEIRVIPNIATQGTLYDGGELDILNVTGELVDRYADAPNLVTGLQTRIMYFYLSGNTIPNNKILANINFRKAISLAFDKTMIVEHILKNNSKPLEGLVPRDYVSIDGQDFRDFIAQNNDTVYDVTKANNFLEIAKEELGVAELAFDFAVYGSETYTKVYENIKSQIETNLPGVTMNLVSYPEQTYYQELSKIETAAGMSTWSQHGGDLGNFTILYEKNGADNFYGYNDVEFERLVELAKNADTLEEQFIFYAQAENLLIEQAVYIPVYQEGITYLINQKVTGFKYNAKSMPSINYKYLDISNN